MTNSFETIVVGLGAVGSAAAYHLSRRGIRVLGLDRHAPPHTLGSSHGGSRIVRRAYFEGRHYLPLLSRSWTLWRELEEKAGRTLVTRCGSLTIGRADRPIITQARYSAETLGLLHAVLTPNEAYDRFPMLRVPDGALAILEVEAGLVSPEEGIRTHLELATGHGATLNVNEPVVGWSVEDGDRKGVVVKTSKGTYRARGLVLTGGGWLTDLLPGVELPLSIEQVTNVWFQPRADAPAFGPTRCPVFIWEYEDECIVYGFPDLGEGVKVGIHYQGTIVDDPEQVRRRPSAEDVERTCVVAKRLLPECGTVRSSGTCFYTNTPDRHYLLDRHPEHSHVVYASTCSGHGFKTSPAVGEALADLVTDQTPQTDIEPFHYRW